MKEWLSVVKTLTEHNNFPTSLFHTLNQLVDTESDEIGWFNIIFFVPILTWERQASAVEAQVGEPYTSSDL